MSNVRDLHAEWRKDPDYRAAYDDLGPEFELARSLIEARRQRRSYSGAARRAHEYNPVCSRPA